MRDKKGISYARTGRGYIEFAESIFRRGNSFRARHVIAHEKAHFLWTYVFNGEIRADWTKLGGWYQDSTSECELVNNQRTISVYISLRF